jgi:hypothetical protein
VIEPELERRIKNVGLQQPDVTDGFDDDDDDREK